MKKTIKLFATLILIAGSLSSCQKIIDKWFPGHDSGQKKECRIKKIFQKYGGSEPGRNGVFYYNHQGKLDSVIFDLPTGSAGAQFHYWKYNHGGKLIEYRADYTRDEGDYYFIHKYAWKGGKIVRDTAFIRVAGEYAQVTDLQYDNEGRVVGETGKIIESEGQPSNEILTPLEYEYNADGNLVLGHIPNYDDKKSYISTNSVLQFTERNYSKNNPDGVTSYNTRGLPLGFTGFSSSGFLQWGHPDEIEWNCPSEN